MFLQYGEVFLVRCQLLEASRDIVTDTATNYLYTTHRYRVRGVLNPSINSYLVPGVANGVFLTDPTQSLGAYGTVTEQGIRHYMMQPRRRLRIRTPADVQGRQGVPGMPVPPAGQPAAPFNWVDSPGTNVDGTQATLDCNNGPRPVACDVVYVSGTKTFVVDFAFETYINEAFRYTATPPVMLSHVWKVEEDIDQDYYSTRTIEGYARFRGDRLAFLGAMPDDFRGWLFHPRPNGFKRVAINVRCAEDGNSLVYRLVDKQLALSIAPQGVTRIELVHTVTDNGWNYEAGVKAAIPAALAAAAGFGGAGWGMEAAQAAGSAAAGAMAQQQGNIIPKKVTIVTARVWGRQDVQRKSLENVGVNAVLQKLLFSVNFGARWLAGMHLGITHDCSGTYVEVTGSVTSSLTGTYTTLFNNAFGAGFGIPNVQEAFPDVNTTEGILDLNGDGDGHNVHKNQGTRTFTRSTFLGRLATAALNSADSVPNSAPDNSPAQERTPP